jgi:hypothetical protein
MKGLARLGAFIYDFVVGDDWRLAISVVLALVLAAVLEHTGASAWWVVPVVVLVALSLSLRRVVRAEKR